MDLPISSSYPLFSQQGLGQAQMYCRFARFFPSLLRLAPHFLFFVPFIPIWALLWNDQFCLKFTDFLFFFTFYFHWFAAYYWETVVKLNDFHLSHRDASRFPRIYASYFRYRDFHLLLKLPCLCWRTRNDIWSWNSYTSRLNPY